MTDNAVPISQLNLLLKAKAMSSFVFLGIWGLMTRAGIYTYTHYIWHFEGFFKVISFKFKCLKAETAEFHYISEIHFPPECFWK